ncbi:MAG: hypothetical protein ACRD16_11035 [Thermoanaerobaculia bacterium]
MKELSLRLTVLPLVLGVLGVLGAGCSGQAPLRLPFQGLSSNSVHRFFPDLDGRENAIRYGRWRAFENAWTRGIRRELDGALEGSLLAAIHRLPDFPPDATLSAPRFSREAPRAFSAILQADRLEREVADALAATDASATNTKVRIERSLTAYRRARFALSEPGPAAADAMPGAFRTAKLLQEGDWLFARSAEDLAATSFREQRWKVKASVDRFDREIVALPDSPESFWYTRFAPTFTETYPLVASALDRATHFRIDVFRALTPAEPASRREGLKAVERAYGLR